MQGKQNSKRPAVFLDRDGVLIENIDGDYVRSVNQIEVLSGAKAAIGLLVEAKLVPVIVTNQAAVAKGFITQEQAWVVQRAVGSKVAAKLSVVSIICPHKEADNCECRKPKPGMLLRAAHENDLDLEKSYFIGDALTDIQAARAAGVMPMLVLTGRGVAQRTKASPTDLQGVLIFHTVLEAANVNL